ncbi:hypothetical protein E0Z06_06970 [Rheinheimera sp. D18]|uniref:hypothetical protein n=1 Tax=Rheinheimera sp. D18 TaxID=2545632 RepID=UPI00104CB849|nr:hypothetical protein [Rheinheimera sp. D18]QBL09272.1 hypothetical protein E0Z06_06970 [Rheinheimera sp. D18]
MRNLLAVSVFMAFALSAQANTLLTDENLNQLEAMLPKLQQLEQRPQNKQFQLKQHCNWSQHYAELSSQEKDSKYQAQIEQLAKQHGFTPVQFVELSAKVTWPILDSVQPMLEISRQAMVFLPEAQRKNTEKTVTQGQQYYKTLSSCLTNDDKTALDKHHDRIMQMAQRLGGVGQMLPKGMVMPAN